MMLSSSDGDVGTRRTIILRPSVEPIPMDAKDLMDVASEISFPEPMSVKTNELVRPIAAGKFTCVCWDFKWIEWSASIFGCWAAVMVGLETASGSSGAVLKPPFDLSVGNGKRKEIN